MAVSPEVSAPYTSTAVILNLLEKNRGTGLPSTINKDVLLRAGVSKSMSDRTLQALRVLDLIDENGSQTETMKGLRVAPEGEYRERMGLWLNAAYADILQYADPKKGDETAVRDAFRPYMPNSMLERMVTLFTGLHGAAGIWPEDAQRARPDTSSATRPRAPRTRAKVDEPKAGKTPPPPQDLPSSQISEKALEYRLVDLMSEAVSEPDVMTAIVTLITFLKTKEAAKNDRA